MPAPDVALAAALRSALRRPPCLIAFSGGRDSSLLLSAAMRTSRADGLPEPIPITVSFPAAGATDERAWQELVLAHLRPRDRIVVEITDELDLLGALARDALARLGPYEPANAHFILPLLAHAAAGSLVVGVGGDELLAPGRWAHLHRLRYQPRARPAVRALAALAIATAPGPLGSRVLARRAPELPWIAPAARRGAALMWAQEHADPPRFDAHVRRAARSHALHNVLATLRRLAAARDIEVHAPLVDDTVVEALARAGGALGWGGRTEATRALAGANGLPESLLGRREKTAFHVPLWGSESRAFIGRWSGEGFDPRVIDAEALRAAWRAEWPDFRSAMLLHAAWCHDTLDAESEEPPRADQ